LIDTSIWIAVERGRLGAADIQAITRQEPVYLSPVNIAEMQFGVEMLRAGRLSRGRPRQCAGCVVSRNFGSRSRRQRCSGPWRLA